MFALWRAWVCGLWCWCGRCGRHESSRTGWRDAVRHPKIKPGMDGLAAVPTGWTYTLPRSAVEAVPYEGCCAAP